MTLEQIKKAFAGTNPEPRKGTIATEIHYHFKTSGSINKFTSYEDRETQLYNAILNAEDEMKSVDYIMGAFVRVYEHGFYPSTVIEAEWKDGKWDLKTGNL